MCVIRIRNIIPNDFTKHVCQEIKYFPNYIGPDKNLINALQVMDSYGVDPYHLEYSISTNGTDVDIHPENFYTALAFKGFIVDQTVGLLAPFIFANEGVYYSWSQKTLKETSVKSFHGLSVITEFRRVGPFLPVPPLYKKRFLELLNDR